MTVVGVIVQADIYCTDCVDPDDPDAEGVVFADTETDCPYHCGNTDCEELIRETLTSDGVNYVREAIRENREKGYGRTEIVDQWAEEWPEALRDKCSECLHSMPWENGTYKLDAEGMEFFLCEDCLEV